MKPTAMINKVARLESALVKKFDRLLDSLPPEAVEEIAEAGESLPEVLAKWRRWLIEENEVDNGY